MFRPGPLAVVVALALVTVVPAGCGGGETTDGVASLQEAAITTMAPAEAEEVAQVDLEEALLAFSACMREEGLDFPDPELDAEGNLKLVSLMAEVGLVATEAGGMDALREAATACRQHLAGVALRFASIDRTAIQDRLLSYAVCMREHGFDLPDPDFSNGSGWGMRNPFPGVSVDVFQDPDFQAANESCQEIFAGLVPPDGAPTEPG